MGETGFGIDQDSDGNVFVTGSTYNGFAFPIRSCTVNDDAYVAKLSHTGALVWNTCLGVQDGLSDDAGNGIAVDSAGRKATSLGRTLCAERGNGLASAMRSADLACRLEAPREVTRWCSV